MKLTHKVGRLEFTGVLIVVYQMQFRALLVHSVLTASRLVLQELSGDHCHSQGHIRAFINMLKKLKFVTWTYWPQDSLIVESIASHCHKTLSQQFEILEKLLRKPYKCLMKSYYGIQKPHNSLMFSLQFRKRTKMKEMEKSINFSVWNRLTQILGGTNLQTKNISFKFKSKIVLSSRA